MPVSILDGWDYKGPSPDFSRQLFATIADMVAFNENFLPEVYECNVVENGKRYRYQRGNSVDPVLGRWRAATADAAGECHAETTTYENATYPTYTNVDLALDAILDKINYVEPEITSFTIVPNQKQYEKGEVIPANTLTFSWTTNKPMTTQTLTDCAIGADVRTALYDQELSANKTFTLTVGDGQKTASAAIPIEFLDKIYWGGATAPDDPANYNDAFILSLANSRLIKEVAGDYTINIGAGEYGYFAMPTQLRTNSFWFGGFETTLEDVATFQFTNANGHRASYSIVRTYQKSLGELNVSLK